MTLQFTGKSYIALYGLAIMVMAGGIPYFFFIHPGDWQGDTRWRGGVYILIGVVALIYLRRCQKSPESLTIDSNGINLNYLMLKKSIPLDDVYAVFHAKPRKLSFAIRTKSGERIYIPERSGIDKFIFDAQTQYGFPLVQFETGNLDDV